MTNAQRNRLRFWLFTLVMVAASAALVWVLGEAEQWRAPVWILVALFFAGWTWFFVGIRRDKREVDSVKRELRNAGVPIPDEPPTPIKLAKDRESLIVSMIALVLIAAVFVAYYTGWLERVGFLPKR